MPTPFSLRPAVPSHRSAQSKSKPIPRYDPEWRCTCCGKLLGVRRDDRMHLRFAKGHEYLVGFPAQATCRGCSTLNEAKARSV